MSGVPTIEEIGAAAADAFSIRICYADLVRADRNRLFARPRQVTMFLAAHLTPLSYEQIGVQLGRDRTTIRHGVHAIAQLIEQDAELAERVLALRDSFRAVTPGFGGIA